MRRHTPAVAGAGLLAVALAGCTGSAEEPEGATPVEQLDLQREPQLSDDPLPEVNPEDLWLPYQIEQLALVAPPWPIGAAQEHHGVFVAPQETDGALEFRAVDADGSILWWAQRPASCTGFVLTSTTEGQDIAVLADVGGPSAELATTVSAHDLHTGDLVWGPVEVPGPHRGPGLVYAEMPDTFGQPAGTVALDADTGRTLDVADPVDTRMVGEYDGVLLAVDETELTALESGGGNGLEVRWQVPLSDYGWSADEVAAAAGTNPGQDVALLDVGAEGHSLLDLTDGAVLAEGVRDAVTDAATGARVLLDADGLHGLDPEGEASWSAPAGAEAQFRAVGGALVYLLDGGAVRVHNTLTGEIAVGYDSAGSGDIAIPELIAPTGAVLLTAGDQSVLATTQQGPSGDAANGAEGGGTIGRANSAEPSRGIRRR
ncbi:hypothetical protein [Ruania zhangjianzhongii]|uniref:hypothetical protein n=1 Tax=Ruania zhangjianzhongii TaxID=2603206 RepID=UPI0011CBD9FA|nr:hypothetical protein [Ruania zhangjianzhongii]